MGGFFRILLGGAVGAVLGILFVKKQSLPRVGEMPLLLPRQQAPAPTPLDSQALNAAAPPAPPAAPAVPTYMVPVYYAPQPAPQAQSYAAPAAPPVSAYAPAPAYPPPAPAAAPPAAPAPEPCAAAPAAPPAEAPAVEAPPVAPVAAQPPVAPAPPVSAEPEPAPSAPVAADQRPAAQAPLAEPAAEGEADVPLEAWFSTEPKAAPIFASEPERPERPAEPPAAQAAGTGTPFIPGMTDAELDDLLMSATSGISAAPSSEVVLAPEVLDDPVPGAGWEPSAVPLSEEEELEEFLPVVPEAVRPYENQRSGAEEPVHEEKPLFAEAPVFDETPVAEEEPELEGHPQAEDEAWLAAGWPEVAEAAAAAPVQPAAAGAPEREPSPAEDEQALGEDLKSRIEETRRRIREELEKPFASVDDPRPILKAAAPAAAPVIGEAMHTAAAPANGGTPEQAAAAGGKGSDYEAMRARIELTRSRLKAKAFDAMMSGESALLGRDSGEGTAGPTQAVPVDSEIERTVDSTLREADR